MNCEIALLKANDKFISRFNELELDPKKNKKLSKSVKLDMEKGSKMLKQQSRKMSKSKQQSIEERCEAAGLRMTEQRRVIAKTLQTSYDHPNVEQLHSRAIIEDLVYL